jgi:hypothetical protein
MPHSAAFHASICHRFHGYNLSYRVELNDIAIQSTKKNRYRKEKNEPHRIAHCLTDKMSNRRRCAKHGMISVRSKALNRGDNRHDSLIFVKIIPEKTWFAKHNNFFRAIDEKILATKNPTDYFMTDRSVYEWMDVK